MDNEVNDEVAKAIGHLVLANVNLGVQLRRLTPPPPPEAPAQEGTER